jgi:mannose-6-phosphate isomerase
MEKLYPLLMSPLFDPRPWGTTDLSPIYPNKHFQEKIGESWLTGDHCKVANGPLAGKSLAELSTEYGRELVGDAAREEHRFPLLLKFLFPHEKLSVQVHPDDELARKIGQPWGKTECWYVAYAKPGAQIGLGLKPGVTRDQFEKSIYENRAEDLLNWVDVFQGEMIYVAGGTVHTLGPNAIIVETQQQSDITYRLYDYGRPRELHLKDGIAAVKEQAAAGKVMQLESEDLNGSGNKHSALIAAPYFAVDRFQMNGSAHDFSTRDGSGKSSVQILVAVEGTAAIEVEGSEAVMLCKGDSVVVPASAGKFRVKPQGSAEFLKSSVPGAMLPEPKIKI